MKDASSFRVGLITPEYPPQVGGVGRSVHRIAHGLAARGSEVVVIVLPGYANGGKQEHAVDIGDDAMSRRMDGAVMVYRLCPSNSDVSPGPELHAICFEWLNACTYRRQFNVLHSFFLGLGSFMTGIVAVEQQIPWVASVRGNDLHKRLFRPEEYPYVRWSLERADAVTFVSAELERRARGIASGHGLRRVIWNSVDPAMWMPCVPPPKILSRPSVIGSVGRFRRKKGTDILIRACSQLAEQVQVLLIGEFAEDEWSYRQRVLSTLVPSHVEVQVTGLIEHSDIMGYYRRLDVLAIPSLHDGCPNVLLEGMASGVPIVASRCGALGDILDKSQAGIVVPPGDVSALADALACFLGDAALGQDCGSRGQVFVRSQWTLQHELDAWLDLYSTIVPRYAT